MMEQEYKYMVCTRCFTFNHAPYIVDAMNGFTMQETSFPVITLIVDDASTDGEPEVIRQYLSEHFQSPYRVEETEYANIICAKHKTNSNCDFVVFLLKYNHYSIKKTKMPYLSEWLDNAKYHALCEGDDYWIEPKKLQKQVDFLETHPNVGLVHAKAKVFNQTCHSFRGYCGEPNGDFNQILLRNPIATLTVCFRSVLSQQYTKEQSAWNTSEWKMGDYPMWLYIASKHDLYFIDEAMAVYRANEGSASRPIDIDKKLKFLESTKSIRLFFCERYGTSTSKTLIEQDYEESCIKAAIAYKEKIQGLNLLTSAKDLSFSQKVRLLWAIIRN